MLADYHRDPAELLLPAAVLEQPPSCIPAAAKSSRWDAGSQRPPLTAADELRHRVFGCELIQEAGTLLDLSQVCIATAQTLLHRFYYRKSLQEYYVADVAQACLFLAAKVEEQLRKAEYVVHVFRYLRHRRTGVADGAGDDAAVAAACDRLRAVEVEILIHLGFSMYDITEHPHKFILYFVKLLQCPTSIGQRAWNYLNDSLRLDLMVRYPAPTIAAAAIFLATRDEGIKLPSSPPWYKVFGATLEQVHAIALSILNLYKMPKLTWLHPIGGPRVEPPATVAPAGPPMATPRPAERSDDRPADRPTDRQQAAADRPTDRQQDDRDHRRRSDSRSRRNRRRSRSRSGSYDRDRRRRRDYDDRGYRRRSRSRSRSRSPPRRR